MDESTGLKNNTLAQNQNKQKSSKVLEFRGFSNYFSREYFCLFIGSLKY